MGYCVWEVSIIEREEKLIVYYREGFGVRGEGFGFWWFLVVVRFLEE